MPRQKPVQQRKAEIRARLAPVLAEPEQILNGLFKQIVLDPNNPPAEEERESDFDRLGPRAYAMLWGSDSWGDTPPNERGDGAYFYAYPELARHDANWLERFLMAIQRTLQKVRDRHTPEIKRIAALGHDPDPDYADNLRDLQRLYEHVRDEMANAL